MTKISKEALFGIIDNNLKLRLPAEELQHTPLDELNIDSLDLLTLNFKFQETFNAEINIEKLNPKSTLSDLIDHLVSSDKK